MTQGHAPRARLDVVGMAHLDVRPLAGLGDFGEAGIAAKFAPRALAAARRPSGKITVSSLPGWPMTWPAVRIRPSSLTTTPLPSPMRPLPASDWLMIPTVATRHVAATARLFASTRLSTATVVGSLAWTGRASEAPEGKQSDENANGGPGACLDSGGGRASGTWRFPKEGGCCGGWHRSFSIVATQK